MPAKKQTRSLIPTLSDGLFNSEAEEAVLDALIADGKQFPAYREIISADSFFILSHRYVYEAMEWLYSAGKPIDYLTVCAQLKESGRLDLIGGAAFVTRLTTKAVSSSHGLVYAGFVKSFADRRRLLRLADEIRAEALNAEKTVDEVITQVAGEFGRVAGEIDSNPHVQIGQYVREVQQEVRTRLKAYADDPTRSMLYGLPTGWPTFDKNAGGLVKQLLYVIGGRPGMGKTSVLIYLANFVSSMINPDTGSNHKVLFFTFEMRGRRLVTKMLAGAAGIPVNRFRNGQLSQAEWDLFAHKAKSMEERSVYIDSPKQTTDNNTDWIKRRLDLFLATVGEPSLVCVDYMQLLTANPDDKREMRTIVLEKAANTLQSIAINYNVAMAAAAQVGRQVEDRDDTRPTLSDLKDSAGLEQAADVVMFPWRIKPDSKIAELIIAKHRDGKTFTVDMVADFERCTFNERPKNGVY